MTTILCIEDSLHNLRLIHRLLAGQNYRLIDAPTGLTGLMAVYEHRPNLVLLDINLPDISGVTVCRIIRTNRMLDGMPIIALTANAMHGDRERFLMAGMNGYVAKPIVRHELLHTIHHLLTTHPGANL